MRLLLKIIAALLLIFCMLLLCRVRVKMYFSSRRRRFYVSLMGFTVFDNTAAPSRSSLFVPEGFFKEALRHIKAIRLEANVLLGTGDAMADVFTVQLLRNVISSFCILLLNTKNYTLNISPCFERPVFHAHVEFVFSFQILKIAQIYIRRLLVSRKN